MAADLSRTLDPGPTATSTRRTTPVLFVVGGLLLAAGGQTHPQGSCDTVDEHLLSMFGGPTWVMSHLLLLAGAVVCALALEVARRRQVLGPGLRPVLLACVVGWGFGALETVPHLLAAGESDALSHHDATPVLDLHVVLQLVATPAVGFTTAVLAVAVARAARTTAAWLLAIPAVVGGVAYGVAGPLVVATGNPAYTALFPFLAGLALWFLGTGMRLLRR